MDTRVTEDLERRILQLDRARRAISEVVVGLDAAVDELFVSLMCRGHVLIEGAPGLGKTLLVRTMGAVCGLQSSRIQFTPDLMPADVTGTVVLAHDDFGNSDFRFEKGPIFAQLVLADEINRATPKTQSALLEAMQERTVTISGEAHELPTPFHVLATQNPIEMEGTYLLPEAQIDRFLLKIAIPFPSADELGGILTLTTGDVERLPEQMLAPTELIELQQLTRQVPVADHVQRRIVNFVLSTQPDQDRAPERVRKTVRFGVSPRGAQALLLAAKAHALLRGRFHVSDEDVQAMLLPALRHRVQLSFEAEAAGNSQDDLLVSLFAEADAKR